MWDMHRDLAACFMWKQVRLEFSSLASRLAETRRWVVHVAPSQRLHRVEAADGRVNTIGYVRPCYPYFIIFYILAPSVSLVFCLGL
jgi:hypothetical protein